MSDLHHKMEESNSFGAQNSSIVGGETQKTHPTMPSNSFPIPLPGRNRQFPRYSYPRKHRAIIGHTLGHASGENEKPTLKA
ncbi:hypothetical protein E2542_SST01250 [Spatholobus suberectus]|nr:hypothetical protein E2542_SST01250 [Spatholobus suberectus]